MRSMDGLTYRTTHFERCTDKPERGRLRTYSRDKPGFMSVKAT